jgi:DNA-binding NarL/FixJ family response regulator
MSDKTAECLSSRGRELASLIPDARFVPFHVLLENEPAWQKFVDEFNEFLSTLPTKASVSELQALADLTERECEVLDLVAQGFSNPSIGARLGITEKTVRNQVSMLLSKLGVSSRSQAIVRAREAGYGRKS